MYIGALWIATKRFLASKFSAKAILLLSQSFVVWNPRWAMSVGCMVMVDAIAGGVIYTRNPVRPDDGLYV